MTNLLTKYIFYIFFYIIVLGWGGSFHFARYYPGEEFFRAIARHEHYLAANTGIKKGMKVLDVGCGVGKLL